MKHEAGWARLWAVVRRRRWPVVGTTVAAAAVGLYFVKSMEPVYQARSIVRIDDMRMTRDYVSPIVNEPDGERLKSARLGFLTQPVVAEAAEKARMLPAEDSSERATALARISKNVDARQESEGTFVVTYEDADPGRAKAFLGNLVDSYAKNRAVQTANRATATAAYLAKEIEELRPRVAEANAKLEKLRVEHYGALPEQIEGNLRILDDNELTAHALMTSLDAAEGRRRDIINEVQSSLRHQEDAVARDLSVARTRYAADAPEVKNLEREFDRVRQDRIGEEGASGKRVQSSAELRTVNDQIGRIQGQITAANQRSQEIRGRIESSAKNGEGMAGVILDRDVLRDRLKSLITKHEEARLAAGIESGINGQARVSVIEPAWVSAQPVKPSKPLFAIGVLALAIGLGLGVGFLLDGLDRRVLATEDVRALIGDLPLLGVVPRLDRLGRAANGNLVRSASAAGSQS